MLRGPITEALAASQGLRRSGSIGKSTMSAALTATEWFSISRKSARGEIRLAATLIKIPPMRKTEDVEVVAGVPIDVAAHLAVTAKARGTTVAIVTKGPTGTTVEGRRGTRTAGKTSH